MESTAQTPFLLLQTIRGHRDAHTIFASGLVGDGIEVVVKNVRIGM